jgi:hypothetical protein
MFFSYPQALNVAKTAARKELNAVQLDLNRMEEYARTHYDELFSEHADVNTRMAFSADLVRAYDTLNRQKVVLDRCNICSDAGMFLSHHLYAFVLDFYL